MNKFDDLAKKLWFVDGETVKLVKTLRREDRQHVEQRLLSLYGASIDLSAPEDEIKVALANINYQSGSAAR